MTRIAACFACLLTLSLGVTACHRPDDAGSEFATGVPRSETVAMSVPGSDAKALTVESGSYALEGQTAEWYRTTRAVTVTVNAGALAVGALVRLVTDYPATRVTLDSAVWGPWQGPLDPIEWKVTITRMALHQYQYKFEGRDKHESSAAFVTVLSGVHTPGLDAQGVEMEGFGAGSFTLDWNARATLPLPDNNVGTANYTYDHMAPGAVVNITAKFRQVKDDNRPGTLVDADYAFTQNPGADGTMDFIYNVPADASGAGGLAKVRSRWQWSGAGRSDVSVVPTDLAINYTVSECWNVNYASIYKSIPLSTSATDNYGSEASCAFPSAEFSSL
jgi:hypothetical protein